MRAALCPAYIDQGRYIGSDPVGYKCSNLVQVIGKSGMTAGLCETCRGMALIKPGRLSFGVLFVEVPEPNPYSSLKNKEM